MQILFDARRRKVHFAHAAGPSGKAAIRNPNRNANRQSQPTVDAVCRRFARLTG